MPNFFSRLRQCLLLFSLAATLPLSAALARPAAPVNAGILSPQAVPTVSSFSPASGPIGASVTITGTGFTGVTAVTFNNIAAVTYTVNSSSNITAEVPAGASSGRVRVINADGTGRSASNFVVILPPVITSFTPATARVGQVVTVNGARFNPGATVRLNGTTVPFSFVSAARLTFVVPVGATDGFITVETGDGTATSATPFVVRPPVPAVSGFSPESGAPGFTVVTITGTDLSNATEVRFGTGATTSFTIDSPTSITVTVPNNAVTGRIRVVTPGGTAVSSANFRVVAAPTLTSFAPTTAAAGSNIVIRGTGFVNVTSVQFNGLDAASFVVTSTTRLTAVVPAAATTGFISLATPSGSAVSATPLTISTLAPTVTSFSPGSGTPPPGPPALGTNVTINGTNFVTGAGNTRVYFNGVQATTVAHSGTLPGTRLTARVPVGATSGPITVETNNGSFTTVASFMIVNTPPTISGTTVQRGCAAGDLIISYTVGDAQTPVNDLTVAGTSPGDGTIITFIADNTGTGANRTATVEAIDEVNGGTTTLTLTVTDGSGSTANIVFNITLDPTVTADAGGDQSVFANQPVGVTGAASNAATTTWSTSGSGTFDDATALVTNYNPSQADYLAGSVVLTLTAAPAGGSACSPAADATEIQFSRPDRIVVGTETLSGIYNNVLIVGGADVSAGMLDVSGSLTVQVGATLAGDGSCAPVTGAGSFTLEDGATLLICHPQGIAASGATGQIRLTGTRSFGTGAFYSYVGTSAQLTGTGVPANLTGSLTVDNAAGVDLNNSLSIRGILRLTNGNLRPGDGSLTILSGPTGTGMVVNENGVVPGLAVVQRYIEGSITTNVGYHHLSSPVRAAVVGDLMCVGFMPIVNPAYNAPANPIGVRPYPNVLGYDETRFPTSSNFTQGYFSPTALSDVLVSGRGYSVYMKGGLTPDFNGELTTGDVALPSLTRTGNFLGGGQKSGWHLLGNPYPSPIDWDLVTVPTGMSPAVSIFRSAGGVSGAYVSYTNGIGTPGTDLIGMGQSFFARVTSATPVSFTFTDACRLTTYANPGVFRSTPDARPVLALSLRGNAAAKAETVETHVYFQDGATAAFDDAFDAARPGRNVGVPTLATLAGAEELGVNALAPAALTAGTRVALLVEVPAAGRYELAVSTLRNLTDGEVYLLDAVTGTEQALTAATRYAFSAATAGEQTNRFALRFGASSAATATAALSVWPNPAQVRATVRLTATDAGTLTVVDAVGRVVRTQALTAGQTDVTVDLAGLPGGVYSVRAGAASARLVVE